MHAIKDCRKVKYRGRVQQWELQKGVSVSCIINGNFVVRTGSLVPDNWIGKKLRLQSS